jgi:hypothetical protein
MVPGPLPDRQTTSEWPGMGPNPSAEAPGSPKPLARLRNRLHDKGTSAGAGRMLTPPAGVSAVGRRPDPLPL